MIIVPRISEREDSHQPEIPLEKTREIDNEARISKKVEMKRKFNKNQKRITPLDIQLSSLISLIKDTNDFLNKMNNFKVPKNSFLVTMDMKALYTNIPNNESIAAVK